MPERNTERLIIVAGSRQAALDACRELDANPNSPFVLLVHPANRIILRGLQARPSDRVFEGHKGTNTRGQERAMVDLYDELRRVGFDL